MTDEEKDNELVDIDDMIAHIEEEKKKEELSVSRKAAEKKQDVSIPSKTAEISKAASENNEDTLIEALDDLDKELVKLKDEKRSINETLEGIKSDMDSTHEEELGLRKNITTLVEKEVELNTKKDTLKDELSKVQKKISRVSEIKDELKEDF